ncbi:MAG: M23 family metallopeptidase [Candidatus Paceibacterota bacterium]
MNSHTTGQGNGDDAPYRWPSKLKNLVKSPLFGVGALFVILGIVFTPSASSQVSFSEPTYSFDDGALSLVVASDVPDGVVLANDPLEVAGFVILEESVALGSDSPVFMEGADGQKLTRDEVITYTVAEGDTLSTIAEQFGISLSTVLWANEGVDAKRVRIGQKIVILPVSGVRHTVKSGDTLSKIAYNYKVSAAKIMEFNDLDDDVVRIGQELLIPGGKKTSTASSGSVSNNMPSYAGYYAKPASGYNWGSLHGNNGVDIANACGATPIYSAAAGTVKDAKFGWNGGYGNMVSVSHDNGTWTLYAHLSDISVSSGQSVSQGSLLGYMGNTGKVSGATGCHLHFEVRGAANPFAH